VQATTTKLLRDIGAMKAQLVAIALVMACGVGSLVMMATTLRAMDRSVQAFYERERFADLFVSMKRAPLALAERIREVPGVAELEPRIVVDVTVDAPGVAEPALGRIISIPDRGEPALNRLRMRSGRMPRPGRIGEVVVNEAFFEALNLQPGDTIPAIINGRLTDLQVVGSALSPEFIYAIRPGGFVPDDKRFGVFWMLEEELAALYDYEGAFNDISVRLTRNALEPRVMERLDALTKPYGGTVAYARKDQQSHHRVADELEQMKGMGSVTPAIFLLVSAMLVNIVVARLVRTQRQQIAVLKAFGYTRLEIALHYLGFVAAVSIVGASLGLIMGALLGRWLTARFIDFFRLPDVEFAVGLGPVLLALGASVGAACAGALVSVWRAARLPPAEAMRPESPPDYTATLVERVGIMRWLSPASRMIVRHIERRPLRAVVSSLGIALAIAIMTLGNWVYDAVEFLIDFQYASSQRYDLAVGFIEPRHQRAVRELESLPGVLEAEPFRAVPVRIRHGHHWRRESITGVPDSPRLGRLLDEEGRPIRPPPEALVLSEMLADLLGAEPGSILKVEVLEGQRPTLELRVDRIAATYVGLGAFMRIEDLRSVMNEGDVSSGAYLSVDRRFAPFVYQELKETPGVATTVVKQAALDSFRKELSENLLTMRLYNLAFACVIAIGVVYNSSRIALAERSHELATLRVLGLYRVEVAAIFLGELAFLALMAIPAGLALGYWFAAFATAAMATETHRVPMVISAQTMAFSLVVVLTAAVVTSWQTRRQLDSLDLLSVLKGVT